MAKINILDKSIYNRISAGEVVERPYSVVKELIENSIDAKANEIAVNIIGGGKEVIEVFDNGCGIEKNELSKAFLPHATSKISKADDLDYIMTLGFRGEALASIGAVSKVKISSKTIEQEIGAFITCEGGELSQPEFYPCQTGTYITVKDLFYNTPARKKFLKTDRSEENDITDVISRLILSNPNIAFKFSINNKVVLQSFGDGLENAIIAVYGASTVKNCFNISNYKDGVKIEGFIGKHNFTKPNRTYQTTIINGRYVINNTVQTAIYNAYASYLMKRQYPFYILNITLNSAFVDVNVTPNKSDVRFQDNSVIYGALYSTISKVLDGSDSALEIVLQKEKTADTISFYNEEKVSENDLIENRIQSKIYDKSTNNNNLHPYEKDDFSIAEKFNNLSFVAENDKVFGDESQNEKDIKISKDEDIFAANKRYIEELERKNSVSQIKINSEVPLIYIGQILNTYLILEKGNDIYLVDQHAAHERLLYNKIYNNVITKQNAIQSLLVPYEFKVNSIEYEFLSNRLEYVKNLGIEIENVGVEKFKVSAIPCDLIDIDLQEFFYDILQDNSLKKEIIPNVINEKLMQKACKSAIKGGMNLDKSEIDSLLKLLNGNLNLKCPHGRPIAVKITKNEIEKWFKRIV